MIVTCPNCQTRYNLPDDKIPAGGAKVKCSKCAHVFKAEAPPASPEDEVENLLEEESQAAPDTQAGNDFDETFDEVAAGGEKPADETPEEEASPEDESLVPTEPDEDMPGMDDLFDDTDETPDPEPAPTPSGEDESASRDDVDSLFGDDEDSLFDDEDKEDEETSDTDDLFDESGDDDSDLFDDEGDETEDDEDEEEDEEYDDDFSLDDDEDDDEEPRSRKSLGCLIILLVIALLIGAGIYLKAWTWFGLDMGSYFQNVPYIGKMFMEETGGSEETPPGESPADRVRKIELKNVKQYYVANEKTGNLFVVEGKAVNKFAAPKERIKVEVILYDKTGNVLTSQAFMCGNVLSQFQLQVQTEGEIKDGLASEVGILSNNTFIRPGASTPFMAVFFQPPTGVKEFLVKVVDVGDPK
ncbi:DUF3426 domain-containing protein [uncultured Pseudodesulfovibrio sp.]|uniref:DUF3426 domain-containing protein n=1 Tax=uncultured Pseudodesulfovibrio sp. TaxID=2035858 RepID=UPI0029C93E3B|nr:DUF3426 domain-containing protein [uncultured Pseudodesulfovibrio sp.]